MAKKLLSVWLSLTILLFSSISIYAEETVIGDFYYRNININGTQIFNYELNNPLFLYESTTYIPLYGNMSNALGLECKMDWESRTLKLLETKPTATTVRDAKLASDMGDVTATIVEDVSVKVYEPVFKKETPKTTGSAISEAETEISVPELFARNIDLKGLPLLVRNGVTYLPVKALTGDKGLGWSIYYDSYSGLYISTKPDVQAKTYWNAAQSKYNKGLVNYIRSCNSSVSVAKAQELVALFQHEAKINNVSTTLLMAVAQKESTFNTRAKARGGAVGLMQIMPSTARAYGISQTQLLDPHINIRFGAKYVKDRLDMYGGNATKALSAYNQGTGAVNRGSYTTRYSSRILNAQENLKSYLSKNGYGKGY